MGKHFGVGFVTGLAIIVAMMLVAAGVGACAESGLASFYDEPQSIACGGGQYDPEGMTAAHRSLPCGTKVRVTNKKNGKSVIVRINDRGPFVEGRIIDLSARAARELGMVQAGVAPVRVEEVK